MSFHGIIWHEHACCCTSLIYGVRAAHRQGNIVGNTTIELSVSRIIVWICKLNLMHIHVTGTWGCMSIYHNVSRFKSTNFVSLCQLTSMLPQKNIPLEMSSMYMCFQCVYLVWWRDFSTLQNWRCAFLMHTGRCEVSNNCRDLTHITKYQQKL